MPSNDDIMARDDARDKAQAVASDDGMAQPVQSDRPTGTSDLTEAYDKGVAAGYLQCIEDFSTMVENQRKIANGSLPRVNL